MIDARKSLAVVALFGLTSASIAAEPDYSTPKGSFRTYTQALASGNAKALKDAVITSPKIDRMLDGQVAYSSSEKKFRTAVIKAYPAAGKDLPDPTQQTLDAIEKAEVKIQGDTATLVTRESLEPVKLKKDGTKWKVDLAAMYADDAIDDVMSFRKALADVMDDMTPDVEAAKYKNFDEIKNTLEMRVKMRIALPQNDDPTSKPPANDKK